jgi:hypothetical protein
MNDDGPENAPFDGEVMTGERPAAMPAVVGGGSPFAARVDERTNAGAVAIESQRATAEVQGRMVVAQRFPRSMAYAYTAAMDACKRIGLAECAIYTYNKGGKVEGPSIRLAEELARVWGNIEYGINELSRTPGSAHVAGSSEMEAFAWDLQTNTRSSQRFTVAHIRDKTDGGKILTSERDIYEITANQGARRMRARILAILPPELVDDAVATCKQTIKNGGSVPFSERVRQLAMAFQQIGVNPKMLADSLGHSVDDLTPDELVRMRGTYQAIKDGAKVSDFFGENAKPASRLDALEKTVAPTAGERPVTQSAAETAPGQVSPLQRYVLGVEATTDQASLDRFIALPESREIVKGFKGNDRHEAETSIKAQTASFNRAKPGAVDPSVPF